MTTLCATHQSWVWIWFWRNRGHNGWFRGGDDPGGRRGGRGGSKKGRTTTQVHTLYQPYLSVSAQRGNAALVLGTIGHFFLEAFNLPARVFFPKNEMNEAGVIVHTSHYYKLKSIRHL